MKYHTMILKVVLNNIMTYVGKTEIYKIYTKMKSEIIGNFYFYLYKKNFNYFY